MWRLVANARTTNTVPVDERRDDGGVGDGDDGRAIDDDAIEAIRQIVQKLLEAIRVEEVCGVGRSRTGGDRPQVLDDRRLRDLVDRGIAHDDVGDSRIARAPEDAVKARTSKVAVDDADALPALRQGDRDAARDRRLPPPTAPRSR